MWKKSIYKFRILKRKINYKDINIVILGFYENDDLMAFIPLQRIRILGKAICYCSVGWRVLDYDDFSVIRRLYHGRFT